MLQRKSFANLTIFLTACLQLGQFYECATCVAAQVHMIRRALHLVKCFAVGVMKFLIIFKSLIFIFTEPCKLSSYVF